MYICQEYRRSGVRFAQRLDGEFAVALFDFAQAHARLRATLL